MMPIVMTDPAKNPRTASMLINVGAVWEIDPQSTQFAQFPPIWQHAAGIIQELTQQIFQVLGVNPSMLPQQTGVPVRKRNQAEVALEQQVDILSTSQECTVLEQRVLSPMATMWAEYDHQFRDDEVTVRTYGAAGYAATMESVPMLQSTTRYHFMWYGVEQARNAAVQQQQIALLNVAMSPAMQQSLQRAGKMIDPSPALERSFGTLFGWREGRKVIVDLSAKYAIAPDEENDMFANGFDMPVHPRDDDARHMREHAPLLQHPNPRVAALMRDHMTRHTIQQGLKAQQQAQQMGQGMPGAPAQPPGGAPGGGGPAAGCGATEAVP